MNEKQLSILRFSFLSVLAFLILFSYGIARPAIESLFIKAHTSNALPNVWIVMSVCMILIVSLYNMLLSRFKLMQLNAYTNATCALLLAGFIFMARANIPYIYYILYSWKDIYVIILVEIFYSYTNAVYPLQKARWYYGFFGAFAALGGVLANLLVGPLAKEYSTNFTLWIVVATLMITTVISVFFSRFADKKIPDELKQKKTTIFTACKTVNKSYYLLLVLFLIGTVQLVITLIDFDFNRIIEAAYPLVDARTDIMGKIYSIINASTFVLHLLTGLTLRLVGVPLTLMGVPLILAACLGSFIALPGLITVAVLKVSSKIFDYSIFKVAKECLYIPLSYEEQTQGKSLVDMIIYRVGKVGASLIVKLLILINTSALVSWITMLFIGIWIGLTSVIVKRFRKICSRKQEIKGKETL